MSEQIDHQAELYDQFIARIAGESSLSQRTQSITAGLASDLGRQIASSQDIRDTELMRTMVVLEREEVELAGKPTDNPRHIRHPLHRLEGEQAVDTRSFALGALFAMQYVYSGFREQKIHDDAKQKRDAELAPFKDALLAHLAGKSATHEELRELISSLVDDDKLDPYTAHGTPALHDTMIGLLFEGRVQQVREPNKPALYVLVHNDADERPQT